MRSSSANWRNTSGRPLFEKNLTTAFLYPLAGITYDMASHPDIWLFLRPDKEEQTHELIFRCEDWELFSEWIAMTRTPVEAQWMQDEGYYAVILLSEEENENIVKPFLNGKFSEMSKDLINSYPKLVDTGKVHTLRGSMRKVLGFSLQKKICTKSRDLREFWENYLDATLPQDAEVWSKPELKDEYYQADEAFHESDQDDGERPGSSTTPTDE